MNVSIDKDLGKKVGEAILITVLFATVSNLVALAFEKLKKHLGSDEPTDNEDVK